MQGVPGQFDHPTDIAQFRHPPHRAGVELYRAHIVQHAFELHCHDGFGLGAIESGVERFRYRGAEHLAPPDSLVTMHADELHTGSAVTAAGWRYRMLYIEPALAARITGEPGWWFDQAVRADPAGTREITALLDALWQADEPLAFDSLLAVLLDRFRRHARVPRAVPVRAPSRFAPVIDYLHSHLAERLSLDELAAVAGLSPFHFLRQFRTQHHATPQQMLMALRLARAKRLLDAGEPPARVAADTGLSDQAHLTRAFLRRYGVTPARYQRQVAAPLRP
ncbi:MAG: AraC family transcriptional regulator [Rhodanobacter sp. 68-29]|uniref:AraC family transcriptional regulator n=1 Tax=Rhodanobacter sp. PCA2 TaxID=2006117 RepID=UPI000869065E|nr:AraC family transcriptional regulator [Rhodanobacter sp. PCA2]MBA2077492.1 AraC family transcriptional regulator [Rhodanobacter sp. PCA2]MBN8923438.1 AraC family transcriptional regulator [Rhodanobacter sp.]ODU73918.1 MAG: AraC family transcriptional regulator [Rhodanobacter sp. SCN 69-32]OJY55303.1 MAG: AraC family transcriptional regulator [Rhodanobacter sp. 68-29]